MNSLKCMRELYQQLYNALFYVLLASFPLYFQVRVLFVELPFSFTFTAFNININIIIILITVTIALTLRIVAFIFAFLKLYFYIEKLPFFI